MESPEKKFKNILKEIRLYESGPTVDGMERLGLNYHKNFGVSLINLKNIAERYKKDHNTAKLLRTKNFRETLILSFMIDEPGIISDDEFEQLLKIINNQELAEQFTFNILEKDEKFHEKAESLILNENTYIKICGFLLYAKLASKINNLEDEFFETFFPEAEKMSLSDNIFLRKAVARALRQTALRNNNLKQKVLKISEKIKKQNSPLSDLVWEEVVPLINPHYS